MRQLRFTIFYLFHHRTTHGLSLRLIGVRHYLFHYRTTHELSLQVVGHDTVRSDEMGGCDENRS